MLHFQVIGGGAGCGGGSTRTWMECPFCLWIHFNHSDPPSFGLHSSAIKAGSTSTVLTLWISNQKSCDRWGFGKWMASICQIQSWFDYPRSPLDVLINSEIRSKRLTQTVGPTSVRAWRRTSRSHADVLNKRQLPNYIRYFCSILIFIP